MRASRRRWHLDEVLAKVNGVRHCLWRALGHEGEVLEASVSRQQDKTAALRLLRRLTKRRGRPAELVADGLRSQGRP